jgi:hypothetical protein
MGNICKNCNHWSPVEPEYGICSLIIDPVSSKKNERINMDVPVYIVVISDDPYAASVLTEQSFGCNQFIPGLNKKNTQIFKIGDIVKSVVDDRFLMIIPGSVPVGVVFSGVILADVEPGKVGHIVTFNTSEIYKLSNWDELSAYHQLANN